MHITQKLDAIIEKNNSLLCVGLDSDITKLPSRFTSLDHPQFEFNKYIIDQTKDLVCGYKPNTAFYEALGETGVAELKMTMDYIHETCPDVITVLDAKRADIGNTNNGYVQFAYQYLGADSITLHPYLGKEALQPFLDRTDRAAIILCRTSNSGSAEIQDLLSEGEEIYLHIARKVATEWNRNNNCMLVVGATYPKEIAKVRAIVGEMTLLVPGIGAQGGDVEKTVRNGLNAAKKGMMINSSRGIIFADNPRAEAQKLRDEINSYR
jgi:orotidine-5'-phosphate decarboxylase